MPVDIKALAARLKEYEDGAKASEMQKLLWKPKEGEQVVRLLPYQHNENSNFIELKFYYKIAGQTFLAPCTFGKPDPGVDLIETLRAGGSQEEKDIATKITKEHGPTLRIYAPVLVRGEEDFGPRFWGFGVQVHRKLLKLMVDPNWGDITSWTEGNDLTVEYHKVSNKKNAKGEPFPDIDIRPIPRKTPVVDPTRKDWLEKIKNQANILSVFPLKSYEEIKTAFERWLNPEEASSQASTPSTTTANTAPVAVTPAATPADTASDSSTATAPATGNLASEFAGFFAKK